MISATPLNSEGEGKLQSISLGSYFKRKSLSERVNKKKYTKIYTMFKAHKAAKYKSPMI